MWSAHKAVGVDRRCSTGMIISRGPQQAEILDTDAEIRDPKSQAIFSDYFRKIRKFISRELQCETSCYGV